MTAGQFIARETALSIAINAVLSAGFCWLVFGGGVHVPIWGVAGFVADYLPQAFMIGLMGALIPGLLARKARIAGRVGTPDAGPKASIVRRAIALALASAGIAVALAAALCALTGVMTLSFAAAMAIKVASGIIIAAIITPRALRAALA